MSLISEIVAEQAWIFVETNGEKQLVYHYLTNLLGANRNDYTLAYPCSSYPYIGYSRAKNHIEGYDTPSPEDTIYTFKDFLNVIIDLNRYVQPDTGGLL